MRSRAERVRARVRPGHHDGDVDLTNLRTVALGCTAVVTAAQTFTAALALPRGRRDYADAVWGPGLAAIALTSAALGRGDRVRRVGLAAVITAWAARLEHQMLGRLRASDEEDPRYTEFLEGAGTPQVIIRVFLTQGLSQLIVSAPVQVAAASRVPRDRRRWLVTGALALMVAGALTEAVADRQKSEYSTLDDAQKPEVLDTGLWGWSRHPNYLGDSVVWDGAWLAAAVTPAGLFTLPAPILMTYLLMFATGATRTERRMEDRPGYRDYQRRVAFFFPRPARA